MQPKLTPEQRFWSKVDPCRTDGCALWLRGKSKAGYGMFFIKGRMTYAHHFLAGTPPEGFERDHLCRVRHCVWPSHLDIVTKKINILRGDSWSGRNSRKQFCPQGHEYTTENTYVPTIGNRACRLCRTIYHRRWRASRK